jgi:hypothetical protein
VSEYSNRYLALQSAIEHVAGSSVEEKLDVIDTANKMLTFLDGEPEHQNPEQQKSTAVAPKAPRQKKTAAVATAPVGTTMTETPIRADAPAPSDLDDLFGEDPKTEPVKEEKAKAATIEDVRNALVEAQTALGGKDHAIAILVKFTTNADKALAKLPESKYGDLIKACASAVAASKKG